MTSFAMTIWIYKETNSAFAVSMITFCTYLPMVIASFFQGHILINMIKKE